MAKSRIRYGTRPLGNSWGIRVDTWHGDGNTTQDRNRTPWPTRAIALDRAQRSANCAAENEGIRDVRAYVEG